MQIRKYRKSDIPAISRLYYETVHKINSMDYSRKQIEAWALCVYPESFWKQRFRRYEVYVAEQEGGMTGFVEIFGYKS